MYAIFSYILHHLLKLCLIKSEMEYIVALVNCLKPVFNVKKECHLRCCGDPRDTSGCLFNVTFEYLIIYYQRISI